MVYPSPTYKDKDKIKKRYLTSLIMKQTTLAHEIFCDITMISLTDTYLPYSIFLAQPLFIRASVRELLQPFFHLWYGTAAVFEPATSHPKADTLPTDLSSLSYLYCVIANQTLNFDSLYQPAYFRRVRNIPAPPFKKRQEPQTETIYSWALNFLVFLH